MQKDNNGNGKHNIQESGYPGKGCKDLVLKKVLKKNWQSEATGCEYMNVHYIFPYITWVIFGVFQMFRNLKIVIAVIFVMH